jgi:hypothetical protein
MARLRRPLVVIGLRLATEQTPPSRLRYRVRTPSGRECWVLTRGR